MKTFSQSVTNVLQNMTTTLTIIIQTGVCNYTYWILCT